MKTDLLADRHIGIQEADLPAMLEKIGVKSLDELINKTIPSKIRLKEPLALAAPMTEREFAEHIAGLASLNKIYTSYIAWAGMTPSLLPLSNAMCLKILHGTPLILLIRQKFRKDAWKRC